MASSATIALHDAMTTPRETRVLRVPEPTPPTISRGQAQDRLFQRLTMFFALLVLALLFGILGALAWAAVPAFQKFGPAFLVTNVWNPVTGQFGALAPIYGTLVTSAIALVVGVPLSFGIAIFLTEMCPTFLK